MDEIKFESVNKNIDFLNRADCLDSIYLFIGIDILNTLNIVEMKTGKKLHKVEVIDRLVELLTMAGVDISEGRTKTNEEMDRD